MQTDSENQRSWMSSAGKLLIAEPPLLVLPSLAVAVGLNCALVLQQLHYWLNNPKVGFERDGERWVANTYEEWQENFPFWSIRTIQRIFADLENKNIVLSEQFDKSNWDQRKAYRINYVLLDSDNLSLSRTTDRPPLNRYSETTVKRSSSLSADEKEFLDLFKESFGKFNGYAEADRYLAFVKANGEKKAREIINWALKREIHLTTRSALMDSLETAALNWAGRNPPNPTTRKPSVRPDKTARTRQLLSEIANGK